MLKIIKGYFVLNIFNLHNAKTSFASTLYRKRGLVKNVRFRDMIVRFRYAY